MKIATFLQQHELSGKALAKQLGYASSDSVNGRVRRDEDIPDAWLPKLAELGYAVDVPLAEDGTGEQFRQFDQEPTAPEGAPQAPQAPVALDYASVQGYISGAYRMAADYLIVSFDADLALVVNAHANQAGVAWAHWIQSNPKAAAFLERMMVGTPAGEVIFVHASIVFAYVLARSAARQVAADAAARTAATFDGSPDQAAEDLVAGA